MSTPTPRSSLRTREANVLQRLAAWCYRRRRRVLLLWLAGLVSVSVISGAFGNAFAQSFSLPGTESQRAADLLAARFPARAGDEGQIVFSAPAGVRDPAVQARMEALFAEVARVPGVTSVASPYAGAGAQQVAKDGTVAYATVQFAKRAFAVPQSAKDSIRHLAERANGGGLRVELGGRMFQKQPGLGPTELVGILAAGILLLVVFGSVLAMGLPIVTALFGIGIGLGFVQLVSHAVSTPDFATQLAAMLGIGVGIDYALFIVTRYRQGLHQGLDPQTAVVRAIDTAGRAGLFAGCTVEVSLLGLLLLGVEFVRGLPVGPSVPG